MPKPTAPILRPFTTDYAGLWAGHCKTRDSAVRAAVKNAIENCVTNCTVTDTTISDPKRADVAWIHRDNKTKTITIKVRDPFSSTPIVKRVQR